MKTNIAINTEPGLKSRIYCMKSISRKHYGIPVLISVLFIILNNQFTACTNMNSPFYNQVLNDFYTTSYFIAVDIKSPFYKGRTIIENNNLYLFLNKTKGFHKQRYLSYMERTLTHHRSLKIDDKDFAMWKFIKVYELESVIQNTDRGRDNFVANYFNGTLMKYGFTEKEQNAVINQLFYWGIPAKIDKLTGELIIG